MKATVRIGGACAFIGDSVLGPRQLADVPGMQYLVFDYLAEMTMSAFVQARRGNAALGYATDFVDVALRELLPRCAQRGIKLVANAGGLNPRACAQACEAMLRKTVVFSLRAEGLDRDNLRAATLTIYGDNDTSATVTLPYSL